MAASFPFDAEPITSAHAPLLQRAFAEAGKTAWCYYAPFLHCYSLPPGRRVFVMERGGALWILVRRDTPEGQQTDLMVPPLPFSCDVLEPFVEELGAVNSGPVRILWMDERDSDQLTHSPFRERFSIRLKDTEYLYDPAQVAAASGKAYRDLRKRLNRFGRRNHARFREMSIEDVPACMALLRQWRRRQGRRHPFLLDWGYTRAALERYSQYARADLRGWCVEIAGKVVAFAMGGQMREDLANFFVAKTDTGIWGLSEYLRWEVFRTLSEYSLVNDAGDLGLPGLRQHKRKFRPVKRLAVYAAVERAETG